MDTEESRGIIEPGQGTLPGVIEEETKDKNPSPRRPLERRAVDVMVGEKLTFRGLVLEVEKVEKKRLTLRVVATRREV